VAAPAGVLREPGPGKTTVDWSAGQLLATGAAVADPRAPNPDVARVSAERAARERALEELGRAARKLELAGGGSVGERARGDAAVEQRLAGALERARTLEASYGSDGSTRVVVALPLEAVRLAVAPAAAPNAPPGGPTAIVVDARAHKARPVLGVSLHAGATKAAPLPTVWYADVEAAAADPRAGARLLRTEAKSVKGGVIEVALAPEELEQATMAGALVIVVVNPGAKHP
jgi:hypothetical protein